MFTKFADAISAKFTSMAGDHLYKVDVPDLFDVYLAAFPEGTDPVYKTRTEHSCNCCKQFLRNVGSVVTIKDGAVRTLWDDHETYDYPYNVVAKALAEAVSAAPIRDLAVWDVSNQGTQTQRKVEDGTVYTFNHFYCKVPQHHIRLTDRLGAAMGEARQSAAVLETSVKVITLQACNGVLEMIGSKTLYRGQEMQHSVKALKQAIEAYNAAENKHLWLWANHQHPARNVKNSAIGTLLLDLSKGEDEEVALRKYEAIVAPVNYKRPSALVTQASIAGALKAIADLGLEEVMQRRHATLADVSVNNVLWVGAEAQAKMKKTGLAQVLAGAAKTKAVEVPAVSSVPIEKFMQDVAPKATSMEVLVEKKHVNRFVNLIAPATEEKHKLFSWDNNFSWSYDGNVTDSIKERVKKAGGAVEDVPLRVSLAWFNKDDLDLSAITPKGKRIYFGDKQGVLDVDMNVMSPVRDAVENLAFKTLEDGCYTINVNQYNKRESTDIGFELEVATRDKTWHYTHSQALVGTSTVLAIHVLKGKVVKIEHAGVEPGETSAEKWGITTGQYVNVTTIMQSPNFWDGQECGNKHWFFFLEGCANPLEARSFYNEFLRGDLRDHRKVLEVLASKLLCKPESEQMGGLGFSSTLRGDVTVKVATGSATKVINVTF